MIDNLIKYGVAFGPTLLFVLIVLIRVLIGYFSGARKQVIFIIHSVIAFSICLILYFVLVNNKFFDKFILDVINKFMGQDGLENALGVSPDCTTMREVLLEYIPSQMNFFDGLSLILQDNGAYLLTLINVSFHIILAVVLYFIYLLLEGIMFIIYLIFYSERKHRNRKNAKYQDGQEETPYFKHRRYGAAIGLFRGLVKGVLSITFLGSILFVTSGIGKKNRTLYQTDNETYNLGFKIYKEIGSYGEHGIYKVLNMCKDKDDVPYYLYAVDLVFQGGLKDEARGIDKNIYLREELNAYVEFSTDTFDLLMKYGKDDLMPIIFGESEGDLLDAVLKVFVNKEFQAEFKILIDNFDAKTYFINFALSLVDSISQILDTFEYTKTLSPDVIDVLNIAFKKGYLSETISYERELKNSGENVELGYIKPSSLLNENDSRIVLNAILDIIELKEEYGSDKDFALIVTRQLVKYISQLSIIDTNRSEELNPVLKRLYAYVDAKYLSTPYSSNINDKEIIRNKKRMDDIIYKDKYYNNIDWVKELNILVNSVEDVLVIYNDVYIGDRDGFSATLAIFDETNKNYSRNIRIYHELVEKLSESKVLGEALSSILVNSTIEGFIDEFIAPSFKLPNNINYANDVVDGEQYYGEIYYLLSGIEKIGTNKEGIRIINQLSDVSILSNEEVFDLITNLAGILGEKYNDTIFAGELLKSKMLHSLLSAYVIDNGDFGGGIGIYIDKSIIHNHLIDYDELTKFFIKAGDVLEIVRPIFVSEEVEIETIVELFCSEDAKLALESKIFEGTFSSILYNIFGDDDELLIFPEFFTTKNYGWVSTKTDDSEIKKLITALNDTSFDLLGIINGDDSGIVDSIKNLNSNEVDIIINSTILYYSISNYIINYGETLVADMPIIVPIGSIIDDPSGKHSRIDKNTLKVFMRNLKYFINDEGLEVVPLMRNIINNNEILDNLIYRATVSYSLCDDYGLLHQQLENALFVPEKMKQYGTLEKLKNEFNTSNPWRNEFKNLVYGLDDLNPFNSMDDDYDFADFSDDLADELENLNHERLVKLYKSYLLSNTVSKYIYDSFTGKVSEHTLELDKNSYDIYSIDNIEGIIKAINIYDIDIDASTDDESVGISIIKKEYRNYNEGRNIQVSEIYGSMIIRDIVMQAVDDFLLPTGGTRPIIKTSDKPLVTDSNNFYYINEVESLIKLLTFIVDDEEDFDDTNVIVDDLDDKIRSDRVKNNLDILYEDNITGLIFTNYIEYWYSRDEVMQYILYDYYGIESLNDLEPNLYNIKNKRRKTPIDIAEKLCGGA